MISRYMFTTFIVPFITPSVTLITAFVVYRLGRSAYFRQKEYELVAERYLNEGLDAISKNVDRLLAVFRYNWWYSKKIILDHSHKVKNADTELNDKLIVPEYWLYEIWQVHRLKDLIDEDYRIFDDVYQELDVFVRKSYTFFRYELFEEVRQTIADSQGHELAKNWDTLEKKYEDELTKLYEDSLRFYYLRAELQELAYILQSERLSFKKVAKIRYRPEVKLRIEDFKNQFPDLVNQAPSPAPRRGRSKR